ncbi:unnamed protein product [Urochloa humidicola]
MNAQPRSRPPLPGCLLLPPRGSSEVQSQEARHPIQPTTAPPPPQDSPASRDASPRRAAASTSGSSSSRHYHSPPHLLRSTPAEAGGSEVAACSADLSGSCESTRDILLG